MSYTIVTDSSCNLPESLIDELELEVLPLVFMTDGEEYQSYLKGQVTDLKQFYTMMREGKVFTTSLPNLSDAQELFEKIFQQGNDILCLGFSSGLSGTYEGVRNIGKALSEQYEQRTFTAVDTLAASVGQGLIVYYAAKMRQEGKSLSEIEQWVRENRLKMAHWFTVDDLMFLFRGGRVSRTAAFAGSLLNIKPVLHVDNDGKLTAIGKVRGRKKSLQELVKLMDEKIGSYHDTCHTIFISHGDCEEDANYVAEKVKEKYQINTIIMNQVGATIGAHSGPGTMALFFVGDER